MRILLCDDDALIIDQLTSLINEYFTEKKYSLPNIQAYDSGDDLLQDPEEKDIVFLDIEMPGINGIQVGRKLKKQNPDIIIFVVTSFLQYLDDAMRFHVFRYLSKPIEKPRLFQNLKDAIQLYNTVNCTILIETKNGVFTCNVDSILYAEVSGRKVRIHTKTASYDTNENMKYWSKVLDMPCFFRSHRSFIVNMKYVSRFDHNLIYLNNSSCTAYLTRRKYTAFKKEYFSYIESMR